MSNSTNIARVSQLGMSFTAARARLVKQLLFQAIQKLGQDICFKCSKKIVNLNELSIEHKKPWLHVDPKLFWDLNNVTFSHQRCNRIDRPELCAHNRRIAPEGMSWCYRHKKFLPIDQFYKNETRCNGLHNLCKECSHYTRDIQSVAMVRGSDL